VTAALDRTLPDSDGSANWGNRARRFVRSAELPMPERYIAWTRFFSDAALAALATPELQARWSLPIEDPHHTAYAARGYDDRWMCFPDRSRTYLRTTCW